MKCWLVIVWVFFKSLYSVSSLSFSEKGTLSCHLSLLKNTIRSLFCSLISSKDSWSFSKGSVPCPHLILLKLSPRFKSSWEKHSLRCLCKHANTPLFFFPGNQLRAASFERGILFYCPSNIVTMCPSLDVHLILTLMGEHSRSSNQPGLGQGMVRGISQVPCL